MKNLKMKNVLLTILCVGCIGATTVGVTQVVAKAQTPQPTVSVAENLTTLGASVRLSDVTGIRFSYAIEDYDAETNAETNYGMLIVPYDYLAKASITELSDGVDYVTVLQEAYESSTIPNQPIVKTNLKPMLSSTLNKYVVHHSVGTVLPSNYNRPWFALGFIAKADGTYSYAKVGEKNVRDVLQVSSLALQDYYYNAELQTDDPATYALYEQYESVMKNFVTTGIENVVGEGEKLTYGIEGKGYAWLDLQTETTASVTQTQYVNLPYRWTSSNEDVATIDEKTGKVTLVGKGATTLTVDSCEIYSAKRTLNVYARTTETQEGEILYVTEDGGAQGFVNVSNYANFTLATDDELATLTGDYTGKAVTVAGKHATHMQLGLTPRITEEDWDNAVKNGYKNMYIWLNATWEGDGWISMQAVANDNTLEVAGTSLRTSGEWTKFTYELNDTNKAKLFTADNRARVISFYPWNTTNTMLYVGDCGFDEETREYPVQEGEIAFIYNGTSVSNFKNFANLNDANVQPKLATKEDLATLSVDYTGKAVKIISTTLAGVLVIPRITEEDWDKAVAAGYTKMYIWFASTFSIADGKTSGFVQMQEDSNTMQTSRKALTSGEWTKFTYELTEANKAILFADGGGRIARFYPWQVKDYCYYVGDCGFDEDTRVYPVQEGEISFVNNEITSLGNYKNSSGTAWSSAFITKSGWMEEGLTGDYKGNAIKFTIEKNGIIDMTPRITEEDWNKAVANGYTKIYIWVAGTASNLDDGASGLYCQYCDNEKKTALEKAQKKMSLVWRKLTYDLSEENKAILFKDGGARLFRFYLYPNMTHTSTGANAIITGYVGDCGFEK